MRAEKKKTLWKAQKQKKSMGQREFNGRKFFRQIQELMPFLRSINRIVLDFSSIGPVKATELTCLLAEMAADKHFENVEINLEGLTCLQEGV